MAHVNTSFVEAAELTMRMQMRRFTAAHQGFSEAQDEHEYAIALHYFSYNFIRKHQTVKTTPASWRASRTGLVDARFRPDARAEEELLGRPGHRLQAGGVGGEAEAEAARPKLPE
jgi:hypothetical protein